MTLHRNAPSSEARDAVVDVLWGLWPRLPSHGRKAAQFVDLLGYFSMKTLKDETRVG